MLYVNRNSIVAALAATLVFSTTFLAQAVPPKAKLSAKQAKGFAVKKFGGVAQSAKYEFEDKRWQYAVIIKQASGQLLEVEIDPNSGKILDSEKTSAAEEAKESKG